MTTDLELIILAQAGDNNAFNSLYTMYAPYVGSIAYGVLKSKDESKDIIQKVFLKIYENLQTFRKDSTVKTWITRIAINTSIDRYRQRKRHQTAELNENSKEGELSKIYDSIVFSPERATEMRQLGSAIAEALDYLPPEQKETIMLREIESLAYKEIAEIIDIPEGTVMSRLFYARKNTQTYLEKYYPDFILPKPKERSPIPEQVIEPTLEATLPLEKRIVEPETRIIIPDEDPRVQSLSESQKRIYEFYKQGLPYEEMSKQLHLPITAIQTRIETVLQKIENYKPKEQQLEERITVKDPLSVLTPFRRRIYELRQEGLTYSRIAEELGSTANSIGVTMHYIRRQLATSCQE
ncbi:MAG: sigma-70 family RNA polymerase sigma factor [Candidatus Woesearchaeota archaeon]|jgi:RNA polymerase sigma-70 factor (ECF subfamily)